MSGVVSAAPVWPFRAVRSIAQVENGWREVRLSCGHMCSMSEKAFLADIVTTDEGDLMRCWPCGTLTAQAGRRPAET